MTLAASQSAKPLQEQILSPMVVTVGWNVVDGDLTFEHSVNELTCSSRRPAFEGHDHPPRACPGFVSSKSVVSDEPRPLR